jgi:hypothetical protein
MGLVLGPDPLTRRRVRESIQRSAARFMNRGKQYRLLLKGSYEREFAPRTQDTCRSPDEWDAVALTPADRTPAPSHGRRAPAPGPSRRDPSAGYICLDDRLQACAPPLLSSERMQRQGTEHHSCEVDIAQYDMPPATVEDKPVTTANVRSRGVGRRALSGPSGFSD